MKKKDVQKRQTPGKEKGKVRPSPGAEEVSGGAKRRRDSVVLNKEGKIRTRKIE